MYVFRWRRQSPASQAAEVAEGGTNHERMDTTGRAIQCESEHLALLDLVSTGEVPDSVRRLHGSTSRRVAEFQSGYRSTAVGNGPGS